MNTRPTIDDFIEFGYEPNPTGNFEEWCVWLKTNIGELDISFLKNTFDEVAPTVLQSDDDSGLMGEVVKMLRDEIERRISEKK